MGTPIPDLGFNVLQGHLAVTHPGGGLGQPLGSGRNAADGKLSNDARIPFM